MQDRSPGKALNGEVEPVSSELLEELTPPPLPDGKFDVFLSYNSRDRGAAQSIADALGQRGLRVFFDRWELTPGNSFLGALERALNGCDAIAFLLGIYGWGSWQGQWEKEFALARKHRDRAFPVIPVFLPGVGDPPLDFVTLQTGISLQKGLDDTVELDRLAAACRRQIEPPDLLSTVPIVCPYRGLAAFREEDARFFCGREELSDQLLAKVASRSLVAVVGPSGTGKSSVVHAGLLPRIRKGMHERVWNITSLRPGPEPLASLASAFTRLLYPDLTEERRQAEAETLGAAIAAGTSSLQDVTAQVLERQPGIDRLLLVIDQWEELYTQCPDEKLRQRFIDVVLEGSSKGRLSVVLTLRGDFVGRALGYRPLSDRLQDGLVNAGPMTREELGEVIEVPARKVGLTFETGLVERILDDTVDEPGNLPLLEFVLTQLWKERRGAQITHDAYTRMGEAEGAISTAAEVEFQKLSSADQEVLRRVFLQLVRAGEGADYTRRRAALAEIEPAGRLLVQRLVDARLLVMAWDEARDATVEVAHEALIRKWERLAAWVRQDHQFLLWRQRLRTSLAEWDGAERDPSLVLRSRRLSEARDWVKQRRDGLSDEEQDFIQASLRASRVRRLIPVVLALVLGFGALEVWYRMARQQWVADLVAAAARTPDPLIGSLLLTELVGETEPTGGDAVARRLADSIVPLAVLRGHRDGVSEASFSGDGARVVTASDDGSARIWAANGRGVPLDLRDYGGRVLSARFSPDGSRVLTISEDSTVRVWQSDRRSNPLRLKHSAGVASAMFDSSGSRIVTGSYDGIARVWRLPDTARGPLELRGHRQAIRWAAFDASGSRVVTAADDSTALVWRPDGRGEPRMLPHEARVSTAAFSPDGSRLITVSEDAAVRVWRLDLNDAPVVLRGHRGLVWSAAFSMDGSRVVTAGQDSTRIWRADGLDSAIVMEGNRSAAISRDGSRIVTVSDDGAIRVWRLGPTGVVANDPIVLRGHSGAVYGAEFSPDGSQIVTASADSTARVWSAAGTGDPVVLLGHGAEVWHVAFDREAVRLGSASEDGTARVWRTDGRGPATILKAGSSAVLGVEFSPKGSGLLTASADGTVRLWPGSGPGQPLLLGGHAGTIRSARFSPDGSRVAVARDDGTAEVWSVADPGSPLPLKGHQAFIRSAVFSPDGSRLLTASGDGTARVWQLDSRSDPVVLKGHQGSVLGGEFSPDGSRVVTAGADSTARVWQADGSAEATVLRHPGRVWYAAFSFDGADVITASADGAVRVWRSLGAGDTLVLRRPGTGISAAAAERAGPWVAAGLEDGTVWVAGTQGGVGLLELTGHKSRVTAVAFSRFGSRLATASSDGSVRVWRGDWRLDWPRLLGHLRASTTACLSVGQRAQFIPPRPFPLSIMRPQAAAREAYEACERSYGRDTAPIPQ